MITYLWTMVYRNCCIANSPLDLSVIRGILQPTQVPRTRWYLLSVKGYGLPHTPFHYAALAFRAQRLVYPLVLSRGADNWGLEGGLP
jgi:hypothetical protein